MGRNKHALITGVFLVILIAATTEVIYWIGHFERERNQYFVATKESVTGLNPESTVFYRGIAVGKVLSIQFDASDSGNILVAIEVDKDIVLTKGVFATLQLKGVTGLTQLQLEDSGNIPEPLRPGDNPMTRIPLMQSLTDKLMNSGEELLKKADHLMQRLSALLNDKNSENIGDILGNLKTLSDKLTQLQEGVDKALAGIPALTSDAGKTLSHINALSADLQSLSKQVQTLSIKAGALADTGINAGDVLAQTTLPKVNELLTELQATTHEVKRVAAMLENNPQALLLGPDQQEPGPGEPGYQEPK
jgi:phospholipid/cholesterol/gamma-HCH transport system substrate-binding protein